jgi:hypothetical protein
MAPRTISGLARGMALGGHICHENYEFTGVKGSVPAPTYSHDPNLHHGDLRYLARSGHTLGTAPSRSILEFTYIGGQHPLSSPVMAKSSTREAGSPWLVMNLPKEWPQLAMSFWRTTRYSILVGQHPSPASTLSRPTAWEAWARQ